MSRLPRVYIAGPMRNYYQANAAAFDEAAEVLRERGADPVSPIDLDRADGITPGDPITDIELRQCFKRDVELLLECDAVFLLPEWSDSRGAKAEYMLAAACNIPTIRASDHEYRLSVVLVVELARREMKRKWHIIAGI